HALTDPDEPGPAAGSRRPRTEALSIVDNIELQLAGLATESHANVAGVGMARDVRERLLRDPIERGLDLGRQPLGQLVGDERAAVPRAESASSPARRSARPARMRRRRRAPGTAMMPPTPRAPAAESIGPVPTTGGATAAPTATKPAAVKNASTAMRRALQQKI